MFSKVSHLPRQLLKRFLLWQVALLVPISILATVAAKLYIDYKASLILDPNAIRYPLFTPGFILLSSLVILSYFSISAWMAYRLVFPLGRMVEKAQAILANSYRGANSWGEGQTGDSEWDALALALNSLEKNIQQKDRYLKRDEEEFRIILSAVAEAIVATDMEGNLRFYNSQFAILFQKFSLKEKKYRIGEIIRDPQVQDAIRGAQQSGAPVIIDNLQLAVGSTDTIKNFRISFAPLLYSDTKRLRGVLAVFHDITDIRRAEQVRIDFVANVSHELRSPLTSIKGYAETLQADLKSASPILQKCAEAIGRNTNRLIDLVNDLLKISSLESGAELELHNIDLAEWTERIIHPFLKRAKEKNLELKWDVKARQLKADSARLEQVVVNLLENALKYNTSGKNIFLRWEEEENETLLVVGDDGPGIAREHHARLFERFYRVDGGRDREQGGTGLGLSIVKHIVLRHHGRVDVRGDLGQGTEFICTFPNSK